MHGTRRIPALQGILRGLCPRCRAGKLFRGSMFRGFPRMHERCPVCDLQLEREQGYFLGAMYISFGLALVAILMFSVLLWWLTSWRLDQVVLRAMLIFLPLAPLITIYSRVLWIYLDRTLDPG
jgi:uncharacterized protein (DUF983 family)